MTSLKTVTALVFFSLLVVLPIFLSSYYVGLMVLMLIFSIFAMSLNILLGYCGLPSLGHASFFGVAAYTTGFLALKGVQNFWLGAAAGVILSLIVATIFGFLVQRTRGVYFMMITLALSQVLWGIAFKWTSVTHGDDGLSGILRPNLVFIQLDLSNTTVYYYFVLFFFIVATGAVSLVAQSPFGLTLKGIRDSETRMRTLGYNIWIYQYAAFILAGFFASIAGIFSVYYHGYVGPSDLHIVTSAKVLLMVILGGAGTLVGPIVGAFGIVLLENFISCYTERWLLLLGLIYVLVIIFAPQGIYPPIKKRIYKWLTL
jgi:branched-chain amino acid transport system permease protein